MNLQAVMPWAEKFGGWIFLFIIVMFMLRWVFKNQEHLISLANEQNEKWQKVIESHSNNAKEFHTKVSKDHESIKKGYDYQREEHNKMLEGLKEVTEGMKSEQERFYIQHRQRNEEHKKMIESLDEINSCLGRINGYSK